LKGSWQETASSRQFKSADNKISKAEYRKSFAAGVFEIKHAVSDNPVLKSKTTSRRDVDTT
jgi:hypothetical protein